MICPNCDYKDGFDWDGDDYLEVTGEHGDFYQMAVKYARNSGYGYGKEEVKSYACPKCSVVFISEKGY